LCHHINHLAGLIPGCGSEKIIIVGEVEVDDSIGVRRECKVNVTERFRRAARGIKQPYTTLFVTDCGNATAMTCSRTEWNALTGTFVANAGMNVVRTAVEVGSMDSPVGGRV
jgi:hypothetical protein